MSKLGPKKYKGSLKESVIRYYATGNLFQSIADKLGITLDKVNSILIKAGLIEDPKSEDSLSRKTKAFRQSRDENIVAEFKAGISSTVIANKYEVTRARIQQVLAIYGVDKRDGGVSVAAKNRAEQKVVQSEVMAEAECQSIYGVSLDNFKVIRAISKDIKDTPIPAYYMQRKNAHDCKITWEVSLNDWWSVWVKSGKYAERGRGVGRYHMARIDTSKGFSVGNVMIIEVTEASARKKGYVRISKQAEHSASA